MKQRGFFGCWQHLRTYWLGYFLTTQITTTTHILQLHLLITSIKKTQRLTTTRCWRQKNSNSISYIYNDYMRGSALLVTWGDLSTSNRFHLDKLWIPRSQCRQGEEAKQASNMKGPYQSYTLLSWIGATPYAARGLHFSNSIDAARGWRGAALYAASRWIAWGSAPCAAPFSG